MAATEEKSANMFTCDLDERREKERKRERERERPREREGERGREGEGGGGPTNRLPAPNQSV